MVFLVSSENNTDIFYANNPKKAMEFVSDGITEGVHFGIYGAKSKEVFLRIYPEFKGRYFVSIG